MRRRTTRNRAASPSTDRATRRSRDHASGARQPTYAEPETEPLLGNRALSRLLAGTHTGGPIGALRVARESDPNATSANSEAWASVRDPDFNASTIVNDLRRAIDQSEPDLNLEKQTIKRKVDFASVLKALDNLTAAQVGKVKALYASREANRSLDQDLFGLGASGYLTTLTELQKQRLRAVMQGTRGEPISRTVLHELESLPPEVAAKLRMTLATNAQVPANLHRLEAVAAEIAELMEGSLNSSAIERLMGLQRRDKAEIAVIDGYYEKLTGKLLGHELTRRLSRNQLQLSRVYFLRESDTATADACAIEAIRRQVEEADKSIEGFDGPLGDAMRKKVHATAMNSIEAIVATNRREALADASSGKSGGGAMAVQARMAKLLGTKSGTPGQTLGDTLETTFGAKEAGLVTSTARTGTRPHAGSAERHAQQLLSMEADESTSHGKMAAILREIREEASVDVMATARDPWESPERRMAIAANLEAETTAEARTQITAFVDTYDAMAGTGRHYAQIVASASEVGTDVLERLAVGGGEMAPALELDIAIRKKDVAEIKRILHQQRSREGIEKLTYEYEHISDKRVRNLRQALFGTGAFNEMSSAETAEDLEGMEKDISLAAVTGRDAVSASEALQTPRQEELGGVKEVEWLAGFGGREYEVTMRKKGVVAHARDIGDNPETENILDETQDRLQALAAEWKSLDPWLDFERRKAILVEMRRERATLTGDATAYEADNERMLAQIREAVSLVVQVALAIALPGAGGFIANMALNIGASVAANMLIYGSDYNLTSLRNDLIGGILGGAGGKLGEELVGAVAKEVVAVTSKPVAQAAERAGLSTVLSREAAGIEGNALGTAAKEAAAAEEALAAGAGKEAAAVEGAAAKETAALEGTAAKEAAAAEGAAAKGAGAAESAAGAAAKDGLGVVVLKEVFNQLGSNIAMIPLTGGLSWDSIKQGEIISLLGRAGKHVMKPGAAKAKAGDGSGAPEAGPTKEGPPVASEGGAASEVMQPQSVPGRTGGAAATSPVHVASVEGIPQAIVETAKLWPTLTVYERAQYIKRSLNERLAALGIPELHVVTRLNDAGGGQYTTNQHEVAISDQMLSKPALSNADVAALADTVRHEVEHAIQWAEMAQHLAAEGASVEGIMANMGDGGAIGIPEEIAQWAVERQKSGRGIDQASPQGKAAAENWGSVYGDQANAQGRTRSHVYNDLSAAGMALVNAQSLGVIPPFVQHAYDLAHAAYRNLAEERGAHLAGDMAKLETEAIVEARPGDAADTLKMATAPAMTGDDGGGAPQSIADLSAGSGPAPTKPGASAHGGPGTRTQEGDLPSAHQQRKGELAARIEGALAHLDQPPTGDGVPADVILGKLVASSGRGRNDEALPVIKRAIGLLQDRARVADVLADLALAASSRSGPEANRLAQSGFEMSRSGGNEPTVLTEARLQQEAGGQFVDWAMEHGPFYDFAIDSENHGRMSHLIQDLVLDRHLGMSATEFRKLLNGLDVPGSPSIKSQVWSLVFDANEGAGAITPEDLTAALRTLDEFRELR